MVSIRNLHVQYDGKTVVRNFLLEVADSEVVCLRGESGSGKSSVLKAVLGFVDYEGEVAIDGVVMNEANTRSMRQQMAYVPQEFTMPFESVAELIGSVMELGVNVGKKYSKEQLMTDWQMLGIEPHLYERKTHELSGGQLQRVMLSLVGQLERRMLLIDEPTSALDGETTRLVAKYIRHVAQEKQMAVLAVTHSDVFAAMCDRVVTMNLPVSAI